MVFQGDMLLTPESLSSKFSQETGPLEFLRTIKVVIQSTLSALTKPHMTTTLWVFLQVKIKFISLIHSLKLLCLLTESTLANNMFLPRPPKLLVKTVDWPRAFKSDLN